MPQLKRGRWVTPAGQAVSSSLELGTESLLGFYTPGVISAPALKIQASHDGQSFADVIVGGSTMKVDAAPNSYIALDPARLLGAAQVRIAHVDGAGTAVNEAAQRVFNPVFRAFE